MTFSPLIRGSPSVAWWDDVGDVDVKREGGWRVVDGGVGGS